MVVAYHSIFCAYGFWLPNDPRGSWSDFVGAWELFIAGGPATACGSRRSVAAQAHDRAAREAGKAALVHPPMRFNSRQIISIANGFAVARAEADFRILACAILPEHVHIVTRRHPRNIEMVVGHLRSRATKQLGLDGIRPEQPIRAKKSWNRYFRSSGRTGRDCIRARQPAPRRHISTDLAVRRIPRSAAPPAVRSHHTGH